MGRNLFVLLVTAGIALYSCSNEGGKKVSDNRLAQNTILQQQDGTIKLKVDHADTYHDNDNPGSNTAEWNVNVLKSGRYDIWLTSATRDTTDLSYNNKVMLSISDDRIEARPSVDKVISNSGEVEYPYYRADSFIGSLYIQDTGVVNIQLISDKIMPEQTSDTEQTKLVSVSLTPALK